MFINNVIKGALSALSALSIPTLGWGGSFKGALSALSALSILTLG